jgi:hypothetical protein
MQLAGVALRRNAASRRGDFMASTAKEIKKAVALRKAITGFSAYV